MVTIWVLENIRKHNSFYKELDTLLLLTSVNQWKKYHPKHKTRLYADVMTLEFLDKLNALDLWDEKGFLPENKLVDKNIFWASSKLQALKQINEPVVLMDNDFIVYKSFESFLKDKVVVAHDENGIDYYPGPLDPYISRVKHIINRPNYRSVNCCFEYFPDPKFTYHYSETSLLLMEEFTKLKVPNSNYLVFSEQLLLKHLLDIFKVPYDVLIGDEFISKDRKWVSNREGLINSKEKDTWFKHYWMEKPELRKDKGAIKELYNALSKLDLNLNYVYSQ